MPDAVENFCADAPHVFQQVVSDHRMTPHDLFFGWIQRSSLVENGERNVSLADVMKGCRHSKPLHVSLTKSDIECEADRDACHQQTMLKRPFVMPSDFVKP